jgi:Na+-transporting NADH:ubiquinone oxidoreductase subunit F
MFPFTTLLISIGAISGIATFLAILMVIADSTIANYGNVKITANVEKEYVVRGGRTLLSTLMGESVFIPSACGGRGSCGLCKVKVLDGAGQILPTELPWLSEEEKDANVRLSCQVKVKNDIQIQIPEELFSVRQFTAKLARIRDLTHDIKELTLELIEPDSIEISAGQFIQLQTPEYELTDEPVYRAYSVSSPPSVTRTVEVEVRRVPNGICTTYVHDYMKEGDEVIFNGPYGDFFLRDTERDVVCIAGGSGMAPIKAILHDMLDKGINRKVQYFFGAVTKRDLFLIDEMRELESKLPNFKFIPALSAPLPEDEWTGDTGLITEVLDRFLPNGDNLEAYLCGSPGMIDACIAVLRKKDTPEELIYYDKFA